MKFRVFAFTSFLFSTFLSVPLFAGTVEKVLGSSDSVIIKLNKKELERTSAGDEIVIKTSSGDVEAEVKEISGSKAKVYIVFGIDKVTEGQQVRVRRRGGGKSQNGGMFGGKDSESRPHVARSKNPKGPYDGQLGFPFSFSSDFLGTERLGAAHSYRVRGWAAFARASKFDRKDTEKVEDQKTVVDYDSTTIEVGGVYHTPMGLRLGLLGSKNDLTLKVKFTSDAGDNDGKLSLDLQSIGFLVGYAFNSRVAVGVIHRSNEYDSKITGVGDTTKGSQQVSETQASIAYYDDGYEAALLYEPAISFDETDISYERPASITLDYFRDLSSATRFIFIYSHIYHSAQSPDDKNQESVRVGAEMKQGFGSWGSLVNYRSKYYKNKKDASTSNMAIYGLEFFLDYRISQPQHLGFVLDLENSEGDGEEEIDGETEDKKLKTQSVRLQVSFTQVI
jgi:hypothetical protein